MAVPTGTYYLVLLFQSLGPLAVGTYFAIFTLPFPSCCGRLVILSPGIGQFLSGAYGIGPLADDSTNSCEHPDP